MTHKKMARWMIFVCLSGAALAINNCQQSSVGFEADNSGLSGTLLDAQGAPVADALVRVFPDTDTTVTFAKFSTNNEITPDSTRTDANGRFRFPRLKHGHCNLECTFNRNNDTQTVFLPGIRFDSNNCDLGRKTLHTPGNILIKAQSEDGFFLSGVRCDIPGSPFSAISDSSGTCFIRCLPPGAFKVRLQKDGFLPGLSDSLEVQSGETTDGGVVIMKAIISSLVAYWSFNEGSGSILHDRTGNGHDGTIVGAPAWASDGVAGGSLHFNGSMHVEVPTSPAFTGLGDFTLSAWVWQDVENFVKPVMEFSQTGSLTGTQLWVNTSGYGTIVPGSVQGGLRSVASQSDRTGYNISTPAGIVPTGQWNHFAMTYDSLSHTCQIYVNGVLQVRYTIPIPYVPSKAGSLYLGWRPATSAESLADTHFLGRLDEVRIYSAALSASRIDSLYSLR